LTPRKTIIDSFVDRSGAGLVRLETSVSLEQTIDASVDLLNIALVTLREFGRASPNADLSAPLGAAISA
jgi:hypothetical protein